MAVKKSHFIPDTCCWGHRAHSLVHKPGACAITFLTCFLQSHMTNLELFLHSDRSADRRRLRNTSIRSHKLTFFFLFFLSATRARTLVWDSSAERPKKCHSEEFVALSAVVRSDCSGGGFPFQFKKEKTPIRLESLSPAENHTFWTWALRMVGGETFSWRAEQQLDPSTAEQVRNTLTRFQKRSFQLHKKGH